jgi:hypothetical protein
MNKMDKRIEEIQADRNRMIDAAIEKMVKEMDYKPIKPLPPRPPLGVEREDFRPISVLFGKG